MADLQFLYQYCKSHYFKQIFPKHKFAPSSKSKIKITVKHSKKIEEELKKEIDNNEELVSALKKILPLVDEDKDDKKENNLNVKLNTDDYE